MACSCKSGCNNARCSCFKKNRGCSRDCKCTNCQNNKQLDKVEVYMYGLEPVEWYQDHQKALDVIFYNFLVTTSKGAIFKKFLVAAKQHSLVTTEEFIRNLEKFFIAVRQETLDFIYKLESVKNFKSMSIKQLEKHINENMSEYASNVRLKLKNKLEALYKDKNSSTQEKAKFYIDEGIALFREKNLNEATKYFYKSLKITCIPEAYFYLARISILEKKFLDATNRCTKGIETLKSNRSIHLLSYNQLLSKLYFSRAYALHSYNEKTYGAVDNVSKELLKFRDTNRHKIIKDCTEAINSDKSYFKPYRLRALVYQLNNEVDKAIKDCSNFLKMDKNVNVYFFRGELHLNKNKWKKAIEDFNKVISQKPNSITAHFKRGIAYYSDKEKSDDNMKKAIKDFSKVIKLKPNWERAYYFRGLGYQHQKIYKKALDDFSKLKSPSQEHFYKGMLYSEKKDFPKAIEEFSKAINFKPGFKEAYFNRGLLIQNSKKARADFHSIIKIDPNYTEAYYQLGLLHKKENQYTESMNNFLKVIELDGDFLKAYLEIGILLNKKNNYSEALKFFNQYIEKNNKNAVAYTHRGICYQNQNILDKAIKDYKRALKLNPIYYTADYNLAYCYRLSGKDKQAVECYSKVINSHPSEITTYFERAKFFVQKQKYDEAIKDYTTIINLSPSHFFAYFERGNVFFEKGMYSDAILDYTSAIQLDNQEPNTYFNRALCYREINRAQLSLNDISQSISLQPSLKGYYLRASLYHYNHQYQEAIVDYSRCLDIDSDCALVYLQRGRCYTSMNKNTLALKDLSKYIKLEPQDPQGYQSRMAVYEKQGKWEKAEKDRNKILNLGYDPSYW